VKTQRSISDQLALKKAWKTHLLCGQMVINHFLPPVLFLWNQRQINSSIKMLQTWATITWWSSTT